MERLLYIVGRISYLRLSHYRKMYISYIKGALIITSKT